MNCRIVILSVLVIWAVETTESAAVGKESVATAAIRDDKCSFTCALKKLFVDEDDFGRNLIKLTVLDENENVVDEAFDSCNQRWHENDDSCENYFDCIEAEFQKNNITNLFALRK